VAGGALGESPSARAQAPYPVFVRFIGGFTSSVSLYSIVSNCVVRECTFIPWDLTNYFDETTNMPPTNSAYTTNYSEEDWESLEAATT
jgi:hypothetical protein